MPPTPSNINDFLVAWHALLDEDRSFALNALRNVASWYTKSTFTVNQLVLFHVDARKRGKVRLPESYLLGYVDRKTKTKMTVKEVWPDNTPVNDLEWVISYKNAVPLDTLRSALVDRDARRELLNEIAKFRDVAATLNMRLGRTTPVFTRDPTRCEEMATLGTVNLGGVRVVSPPKKKKEPEKLGGKRKGRWSSWKT